MSDEDTVGCSGCGLGGYGHGPNCPVGDDQPGDFMGLLSLVPCETKLADHNQGPLSLELLDQMLAEWPEREARQHEDHMDFILNQDRWQHVILSKWNMAGYKSARVKRMIRDMKFGVPCPEMIGGQSHPYVVMDEAKLPRFTRLRRRLFEATIK